MENVEQHQGVFRQAGMRFADYYLQYIRDRESNWSELEAEHVNLLNAVRRLQEVNDHDRLCVLRDALQPYLDLQGHWEDSLTLNDWAMAAAQAKSDYVTTARFTHDKADILNQMGEYRQAEHYYQLSEQAYLTAGSQEMALRSRHMRAMVIRAQGRLAEADRLCEATITDSQRLGLDRWIAHPLYVRALLARDRGNFKSAQRWIHESLNRLMGSEEDAMIAQCYHFLGELALLQGDLLEARTQLIRSLELSQKVGIIRRVAATQRLLGDVARAEGQYDEASRLYHEALTISNQLGDRPQVARIEVSRGELAVRLKRTREAQELLQIALNIYHEIGDPRGEIGALWQLARLEFKQGRFSLALRHGFSIVHGARRSGLLQPGLLVGILQRERRKL